MPFFRSTHNILHTPWEDEIHNPNWMDSDKIILPPGGPDDPKYQWDYNRDMQIEDVDIWEQIYYQGGGLAIYAAWLPYAEFYMITKHKFRYTPNSIETYYGPGADFKVQQRARELGIPLSLNQKWVDDDELWLYQQPVPNKTIIIPNS